MTESRLRVLLVEDNPVLRQGLVKGLTLFPQLEVIGAEVDGESGVRAALETLPDVVLLDLELPGIDGIEVTRQVKRAAPQVQILMLTTFDEEAKVYEAITAGASGYLVKRVGPEKIRDALLEVHQGGVVIEALIAKRFWNYFQAIKAAPSPGPNAWGLTETEVEVLRYLAKGLTNAEVGRVMTLERRTVRTHLSHVYRKMNVSSHVDAVIAALKAGLVEP